MKYHTKSLIILVGFIAIFNIVTGQTVDPNKYLGQDSPNAITTAAPFLMIAPDSRAGAMGDAGVATSPDPNSMHWNPAKLAFVDKDLGLAVSYTPWLRNIVSDISLSYLGFYKKIAKKQTISFSLLYFSLGNIVFTNEGGQNTGSYNPSEFAIDGGYSFLLSKNLSGGIALRYIYSNLTGGQYIGSTATHAGMAVAADLSVYYQHDLKISDKESKLSFGINVSNIGSKISYTDDAIQNFIPINLRVGSALKINLDDYNSLMFTCDLNKLLVPTPPLTVRDSATGVQKIIYGKDPNVSVPTGIFQSFSDAPGFVDANGNRSVLKEELAEITISSGFEYWYAKQFAIRAGYFNENQYKGNRKYFTFGLGLKMNVFGLDFAYLVPTAGRSNPLANTIRFSLSFDFDSFKDEKTK